MKPTYHFEEATENVQGKRLRLGARDMSRRRWMTPLRWVLGVIAVAPLGPVALLALGTDALGNFWSLVVTYLSDLARSARDFLVR